MLFIWEVAIGGCCAFSRGVGVAISTEVLRLLRLFFFFDFTELSLVVPTTSVDEGGTSKILAGVSISPLNWLRNAGANGKPLDIPALWSALPELPVDALFFGI
jgi:hypothetical protein